MGVLGALLPADASQLQQSRRQTIHAGDRHRGESGCVCRDRADSVSGRGGGAGVLLAGMCLLLLFTCCLHVVLCCVDTGLCSSLLGAEELSSGAE